MDSPVESSLPQLRFEVVVFLAIFSTSAEKNLFSVMKLRLLFFAFFVCSRSVVVGQMADPAQNVGASTAAPVVSSTPEGQQSLMNRLEAMENAFRAMVSALSNQSSDLFAPIKETLVKDPSLRSFLSSTSFLPDAGATPTNGTGNVTFGSTAQVTKGNP